jgi:hypothetical protein
VNTTGETNFEVTTSALKQRRYIDGRQVTQHSVFIQPASGESIFHPSCSDSVYIIPTYRTYKRRFVCHYIVARYKDRFITLLNVIYLF